ncbi:MAG: carboxynorspermidine decarboxylase [Bacteroidales bacterium]|nr:carboxynorspermidine decarboxylase [Candidatus Cryptobacteroides caccocaballi]
MLKDGMKTPCYVIDSSALRRNLSVLAGVMQRTGAHILLAQKAFSCYAFYPMIGEYLSGATASGLFEARLCHEEMPGRENHVFNPAFRPEDIDEIVGICDHIVFNSVRQLMLYGRKAKDAGCAVGLRINPEKSTQEGHEIYDPCAPGSRMGVTLSEFEKGLDAFPEMLELLDGLHFHTLCEQDSDALEVTLDVVVEKFGAYLRGMKWINFGGGHHITRDGYDIARLERCIMRMRDDFGLEVYLEPGEAIALNAGYLHTTVLEIQERDWGNIAILDTSAACHMPDVLEMPYRPPLAGSGEAGEKAHTYRLGGPTCLAGDVIGDYSFDEPLKEGDVLTFGDMAIYSMVKNNTFNGMPLPSIWIQDGEDIALWKEFSYADFKSRV